MRRRRISLRSAAVVVVAFHSCGKSSPKEITCARSAALRDVGCSRRQLWYSASICSTSRSRSALKRTRHQPVLRLHGIVLPAGPLRLVMGPLAPERPLALQQAGLFLKLAPSGDGQGEPIRRQRRQRQALYRGVDRQGSDLLATRPAVLLPVGGTLIYGVVAARPGIAQTHAPAAPTANYDPLQQRLAFAGHARPVSV